MKNIEKYKRELMRGVNVCKIEEIVTEITGKEICPTGVDNCDSCKELILEWLLEECKEPILNEAERKYLSDVIRPFRKSVTYISKLSFSETDKQFISIVVMNERGRRECVNLPNFETGTMYKGVKPNKPYTVEELGL